MAAEAAALSAGRALGARSWLEVSEDAIDIDFAGHKVWFDQANRQLVLLKSNVYFAVELRLGAKRSAPVNFVNAGKTLDVKFSVCRRFLAVQRSDTTVDIVDLERATEIKLSCKTKRGNLVLRGGMLWLRREACRPGGDNPDRPCLCLVTRYGLEVFRLPNPDKGEQQCKLLETVRHTIQCFWHLPDHHVLLLATGNGSEMRPYQFQGAQKPARLAKFTLPKASPAHRDVSLAKLYDSIYCLEVDMEARTLNLYKLGRESTLPVKRLKLVASGSVGISIVDNLICVHSMEGRLSCVYDVAADTDSPCMIPKPMQRARGKATAAPGSADSNCTEASVPLEVGDMFQLEPVESAGDAAPFAARLKTPSGAVPSGSVLTHIGGISMQGRTLQHVEDQLALVQRPAEVRFLVGGGGGGAAAAAAAAGHGGSEAGDGASNSDNTEADLSSEPHADSSMYAKSWVFLAPYWVLDAKCGRVWKIELNLDSVPALARHVACGSSPTEDIVEPSYLLRDSRRLYAFLLRRACLPPISSDTSFLYGASRRDMRAYAKAILLSCLRTVLTSHPSEEMAAVSVIFKLVNDAYLKALRERAATANPGSQSSPSSASSDDASARAAGSSPTSAAQAAAGGATGPGQAQRPPSVAVPPRADGRGAAAGGLVPSAASPRVGESPTSAVGAEQEAHTARSPTSPVGFVDATGDPERANLRQLLDDFRTAGQIALKDIRCYSGLSVVLQIDMFTWVFMPLIPEDPHSEAGVARAAQLAAYLCEYVRSLQQHLIPIEKYMHELLAWLLISSGQQMVLQQLLQYHVSTDSRRLARTLLETSFWHEPFYQVALDMFYRLGAIDCVVRALLSRQRLLPALELLRKFPYFLRTERRSSGGSGGAGASGGQGNRGHGRLPAGTKAIRPHELLSCAGRIASANKDIAPLFSLHSFFVSVDPSIISQNKAAKAVEGASMLAQEAGPIDFEQWAADAEMSDVLRRAFGFPRESTNGESVEPLESKEGKESKEDGGAGTTQLDARRGEASAAAPAATTAATATSAQGVANETEE